MYLHSPVRHVHPPPHTHTHIHVCGPTKHTRQLSFRHRFSFAVFQVLSHAHHAIAADGPRSAEHTHPEHTDDGQLHWLRGLPKTPSLGATTHHVWEAKAGHDGRSKRPSPRAVQAITPAVERWRRQAPTHKADHSYVRCLQRSAAIGGPRPCPTHLGPVQRSTRTRSCQTQSSTQSSRIPRAGPRWALQPLSSAGTNADPQLVLPKRSRSAWSTCTTWSPRNETPPLRSFSVYAHMKLFDVDFVGGVFNLAVKGPVADVFSDAEFMAPGSSPLWGAGGPEGDNVDCTGFLCIPRRPAWGPHVLQ